MTGTSFPPIIGEIVDNLRRIFQAVNEYSKRAVRETGLTGPQLWAIKVIRENEPIRVSDLAHKMYLHPATVVGILDRLEDRGLIVRIRSQKDRRVVEVALTANGKDLVNQAPDVAQGMLVRGMEKMSQGDLERIAEGMEQLVTLLGAREIPPILLHSSEVNLPSVPADAESKESPGRPSITSTHPA